MLLRLVLGAQPEDTNKQVVLFPIFTLGCRYILRAKMWQRDNLKKKNQNCFISEYWIIITKYMAIG